MSLLYKLQNDTLNDTTPKDENFTENKLNLQDCYFKNKKKIRKNQMFKAIQLLSLVLTNKPQTPI